jgi:hypothetical protein
LAGPTLQRLKDDEVADDAKALKKAIDASDTYERRAASALHRCGIDAQAAERERLKWLAENQYILGTIHPEELQIKLQPIRDPEKSIPTSCSASPSINVRSHRTREDRIPGAQSQATGVSRGRDI